MHLSKLLLLNRRQWRENYRTYRTALLAIIGIVSFLFFIAWHWRDSFAGDVYRGIFLIVLFGGGGIFGSTLLKDLTHPSKGMWLIGIPASTSEKLFIAALYAIVLYLIAYLSLFYITEDFFLWLVKQDPMPLKHTNLLLNGFYNFLFTFINFQLLILLGSLSFKRGSLLKTILLMVLLFSMSDAANNYLLMQMTGIKTINGGGIFDYFQFQYAGENVYVYLPQQVQVIVTLFFHCIFPLSLYYIIYLKFRETEI